MGEKNISLQIKSQQCSSFSCSYHSTSSGTNQLLCDRKMCAQLLGVVPKCKFSLGLCVCVCVCPIFLSLLYSSSRWMGCFSARQQCREPSALRHNLDQIRSRKDGVSYANQIRSVLLRRRPLLRRPLYRPFDAHGRLVSQSHRIITSIIFICCRLRKIPGKYPSQCIRFRMRSWNQWLSGKSTDTVECTGIPEQ